MRQSRGFTLVEVLVVVVIVGVLAGVVTLAGGARGDAYRLREQAERLSAVVRLAADEAVLDTREYGLRVDDNRYAVWGYDSRAARWQPLSEWPVHQLPVGMQLQVTVEGTPLRLSVSDIDDSKGPQILLSSSGQMTPFSARLQSVAGDGPGYRIDADGMNDPQVAAVASP